MYATMPTDDTIVLYDNENNRIDEILTNTDPNRLLASEHVAFDPLHNKTYITNSNWNSISVITNTSQVKEIEVGHRQNLILYAPFNKEMYVSLGDRIHGPNGTIAVINTISDNVSHINFDKLYGEKYIGDISYNPFDEQIYFAGSMNVYIVDRDNKVISNIPLGGGPCTITYHPGNNNMYVGTVNGTVTVINSENQVVSSLAVGGYPCSMAYNPINNNIYTRDYTTDTVSVINDKNKLVATIPIPYLDSEKYPG
jgi:DNA-binding beta-propeller fold protein YncE